MKTIIIPTDYSQSAKHAARFGFEVARRTGAEVILCHALDWPLSFSGILAVERGFSLQEYRQLADCAENYASREQVRVTPILLVGSAADEIVTLAKSKPDCMVVMGQRGEKSLQDVLLGTVSARVMKLATFPLMLVPQLARFHRLVKTVFPVDLEDDYEMLMPTIKGFVEAMKLDLKVVNVRSENRVMTIQKVAAGIAIDYHFNEIDYCHESIDERNNLAHTIQQYVVDSGAELLIIVHRHRDYLQSLLNPSLTRKLSWELHIPIVIYPQISH